MSLHVAGFAQEQAHPRLIGAGETRHGPLWQLSAHSLLLRRLGLQLGDLERYPAAARFLWWLAGCDRDATDGLVELARILNRRRRRPRGGTRA